VEPRALVFTRRGASASGSRWRLDLHPKRARRHRVLCGPLFDRAAGNSIATLRTRITLRRGYSRAIEAWEVGAEVRNVRNNRPELMDRVRLL
jgi:hypothetical protein